MDESSGELVVELFRLYSLLVLLLLLLLLAPRHPCNRSFPLCLDITVFGGSGVLSCIVCSFMDMGSFLVFFGCGVPNGVAFLWLNLVVFNTVLSVAAFRGAVGGI